MPSGSDERAHVPGSEGRAARLSELGEFGLISRIPDLLGPAAGLEGGDLIVGLGDDAAAWRPAPGLLQLAHTDVLVEGVDFDFRTTGWEDLGWKAVAVNISDLAAMAGEPRYLLVALGLAGDPAVADVEALFRGIRACSEQFGVTVIGGDLSATPATFVAITAIGAGAGPLLRRTEARPGDRLAVTGTLGGSAGGLELLRRGDPIESADAALLVRLHQRPLPRVTEGRLLAQTGVRCGLVVSDGLLGDVQHICEQSGVVATLFLDRLPAPPALQRLFPDSWRDMALAGGEDFELLVAAPGDVLDRARTAIEITTGTSLTEVGDLAEPTRDVPVVRVLDEAGRDYRPRRVAWDHFAKL